MEEKRDSSEDATCTLPTRRTPSKADQAERARWHQHQSMTRLTSRSELQTSYNPMFRCRDSTLGWILQRCLNLANACTALLLHTWRRDGFRKKRRLPHLRLFSPITALRMARMMLVPMPGDGYAMPTDMIRTQARQLRGGGRKDHEVLFPSMAKNPAHSLPESMGSNSEPSLWMEYRIDFQWQKGLSPPMDVMYHLWFHAAL